MFAGSWLSGLVVEHYALATPTGTFTYDWKSIWLFAAIVSTVVLILFLFSFSDRGEAPVALVIENPQPVPL
jgi:Co/Zn/Cd efflux system component